MAKRYLCGVRKAIIEDMIRDDWGECAEAIIEACNRAEPASADFEAFIEECVDCGDAWGLTLLTGISKLFPEVYFAMPGYLGKETWGGLLPILALCGLEPEKVLEKL